MDTMPSPSPALLEANRRLYAVRMQVGLPAAHEPRQPDVGHPPAAESGLAEAMAALPSHLGWGSQAATQAMRAALARRGQERDKEIEEEGGNCQLSIANCQLTIDEGERPATVKHYPSLGLAALKADDVPILRVWLAGRYLDQAGRGWLDTGQVRAQLAGERSPLQLCGWRRLRQVLGQGDGRYWTWDRERGRLWLFGVARVAAGLGVVRLSGRPVELPIEVVTQDIGVFKAHLYGAWHSGRKQANPISRQVQEQLTGLPERTQRHYCRVAKVKRQQNIAIGGKYTQEAAQECAWRRGRAIFEFYDAQGGQGRRGGRYMAWHLPSSYRGPHEQATNGRQRKINRILKDLVENVAQGNSSKPVDRCYAASPGTAGVVYQRNPHLDIYWQGRGEYGRPGLWYVLPAKKEGYGRK